jgi:hypothetical protein
MCGSTPRESFHRRIIQFRNDWFKIFAIFFKHMEVLRVTNFYKLFLEFIVWHISLNIGYLSVSQAFPSNGTLERSSILENTLNKVL